MTCGTGSHLLIRGRTTTSHVVLGPAEQERGELKVTPIRNGSPLVQVHFYGYMESVCIRTAFLPAATDDYCLCSGFREEHHLVW